MPRYSDAYITPGAASCVADYASPGSCTFTVPSFVTLVTFEAWGAGGGGGAVQCCTCYMAGIGGGGGGYARTTIAVTPGATYTVCVGYGGMVSTTGNCTLHWCCCGQTGGTSYVTGTGLSNFCAVGGQYGIVACFYGCSCQGSYTTACGGAINNCSTVGRGGNSSQACQFNWSSGGGSSFVNGNAMYNSDHCYSACCPAPAGMWPAGGGASNSSNGCCCCGQGGTGGNGYVRISY